MLTLTLTLNQTTYRVGEDIFATVVLTNTGTAPLTINTRFTLNSLSVSSNLREIGLRVMGSDKACLPFGARVNVGSPTDANFKEIAAGESLERRYQISNYYNLSKPDTYTIQAIYQNGTDPSTDSAWKGRVESDEVKIEVK